MLLGALCLVALVGPGWIGACLVGLAGALVLGLGAGALVGLAWLAWLAGWEVFRLPQMGLGAWFVILLAGLGIGLNAGWLGLTWLVWLAGAWCYFLPLVLAWGLVLAPPSGMIWRLASSQ